MSIQSLYLSSYIAQITCCIIQVMTYNLNEKDQDYFLSSYDISLKHQTERSSNMASNSSVVLNV